MCFTPGWHSGDAGVCLWEVHGAAGVHSCGTLRRLEGGGVVVTCGLLLRSKHLHLGAGWSATGTQPLAEFAHKDQAWYYPVSRSLGECLELDSLFLCGCTGSYWA